MPRDFQRSRVYDAEYLIGIEHVQLTKVEARRLAYAICDAAGAPRPTITWRRGGARSFYKVWQSRLCMRQTPSGTIVKRSLLHEISHHLAHARKTREIAGHGPEFVTIYSAVLTIWGGCDAQDVHRAFRDLT